MSRTNSSPRAGKAPASPERVNPSVAKWLSGTWQSDRARTVREWEFRRPLPRKEKERFLAIFGKLRTTYNRGRIRGVYGDYRFTQPYEVLATDSDSVAIRLKDQLTGDWRIEHIHFEGKDRFWISLGGNREWFRRVRER